MQSSLVVAAEVTLLTLLNSNRVMLCASGAAVRQGTAAFGVGPASCCQLSGNCVAWLQAQFLC